MAPLQRRGDYRFRVESVLASGDKGYLKAYTSHGNSPNIEQKDHIIRSQAENAVSFIYRAAAALYHK
jgi:hypothetical protein